MLRSSLPSSRSPRKAPGSSPGRCRNGDAWAAAGYDAVGAKVNLAWSPRAGLTLRAGFRADARRFAEISALDQVEGSGFASVLVNLPSRTTLIGEVFLGGNHRSNDAFYRYDAHTLGVGISAAY